MNNLYYVTFRISTLYLLLYLFIFTKRERSLFKSVMLCTVSFLVSSGIDYLGIYHTSGGMFYLLITFITFTIMISTEFLLAKSCSMNGIFTVLCSLNYILPGNTIGWLVFRFTEDYFSCLLIQSVIHALFLLAFMKILSGYTKTNEKDVGGWGFLCFIPFLSYFAITFLTVWPMNLIDNIEALPGVAILFLLMVVAFGGVVRFYGKRNRKQRQDMSLVFLAEYSDRIKSESAKVNEMSSRLEEMSCAMQTLTKEILDLLDERKYDDIRSIVTALRSDSRILTKERMCQNNSMNSVILELEEHARRNNIRIHFSINIPETLGAAEFEYAVIVERILMNAIKGCGYFNNKELFVNFYPSGAWQNLEVKVKFELADEEHASSNERSIRKIVLDEIEKSLAVPEIAAFLKKYEVQQNVNFQSGIMISEFNVRMY